jgi:hypothetical protein
MTIQHPRDLYCVQIRGWNLHAWCLECRNHWRHSCGKFQCRSYERQAEKNLAHAVILGLESGQIDPPEILTEVELTNIVDLITLSAN